MKTLAFCLALLAVPAFAASPEVCDKFLKAFEKAGKTAGKAPDADSLAFFKKACLKDTEKDDVIKKQTACLDGAKTDAEAGKCMK